MREDLQQLYDGLIRIGTIFGDGLTTYTDEVPSEGCKRLHDGMVELEALGLVSQKGTSKNAVFWTVVTPSREVSASASSSDPAE